MSAQRSTGARASAWRAPEVEEAAPSAPELVVVHRFVRSGREDPRPGKRGPKRKPAPFVPPATIAEGTALAAPMKARITELNALLAEQSAAPGEDERAWGVRRSEARVEITRLHNEYTPLCEWLKAARRQTEGELVSGAPKHTARLLSIVERLSEEGAELTDEECDAVDHARRFVEKARGQERTGGAL